MENSITAAFAKLMKSTEKAHLTTLLTHMFHIHKMFHDKLRQPKEISFRPSFPIKTRLGLL